jgi:hypothetical protein
MSTAAPTPPAVNWRETPEGETTITRVLKQADALDFRAMSRHDLANLLTAQANQLRTGVDEAGTLERMGGFILAGLYARLRAEARFRRQTAATATHAAMSAQALERQDGERDDG